MTTEVASLQRHHPVTQLLVLRLLRSHSHIESDQPVTGLANRTQQKECGAIEKAMPQRDPTAHTFVCLEAIQHARHPPRKSSDYPSGRQKPPEEDLEVRCHVERGTRKSSRPGSEEAKTLGKNCPCEMHCEISVSALEANQPQ